jgi:hypothetical protein
MWWERCIWELFMEKEAARLWGCKLVKQEAACGSSKHSGG